MAAPRRWAAGLSCSPGPPGADGHQRHKSQRRRPALAERRGRGRRGPRPAAAAITAKGGGITYANAVSAGNSYAQTLGAMDIAAGQTVIASTNEQGPGDTSLLTLGGLVAERHRPRSPSWGRTWESTSRGTRSRSPGWSTTPASQIMGPWAATGGTAVSDYAVYGVNGVTAANIAASPEPGWSTTSSARATTRWTAAGNCRPAAPSIPCGTAMPRPRSWI